MYESFDEIDTELAQELYEIVEANVKKILNPEIGLLLVEAVRKHQKNDPVVEVDKKAALWRWPLGFR